MRNYVALAALITAYLVVGFLFALETPDWQAPDEPAHYNYIRQLAQGHLPVIEPGDYNEAYRAEIVSARFASPYSIDALTYEDWQPPLYYLLQTPVFLLTGGALLPLRLVSLLLGAGVVLVAHAIARLVWPGQHWLAYTTAAFVAFLPQHVALLASVNNDSLAELLIALLLWLLLLLVHQPLSLREETGWLGAGFLLGLGFLTKATVYLMAPVVLLALWWRYRSDWQKLVRRGLIVFVPAALLGALWWGRNLFIYGGLDFLGKAAHDTVVVGQLRTADWIAQLGAWEAAQSFLRTTFQSFWGQFGWMGVLMDARIYLVLLLFSLAVLAGLLWHLFQNKERLTGQQPFLLILAGTFLFNLFLYLGYNVTFVQHQGRYLFPALIPIALAVAVGLSAWIRPLSGRWREARLLVPLGLGLGLIALDLLALFQFIVPQLTVQ